MEFELSDDHRALKETAARFADERIAPEAAAMDEKEAFSPGLLAEMGRMGLLGVCVPAQYGGAGMNQLSYVIAMEEISRASASVSVAMSVNNSLVCDPLLHFGDENQKRRYLVPAAKGEMIGCYALTEAASGSDAFSLSTTAVRDGDAYVLNGSKIFISNGAIASFALVFATVDPAADYKGVTAFIVQKDDPGFRIGKRERKLGLRASDTAELIFEDCRIPASRLLGNEREGYKVAMRTLNGGRIGIAAQSLGIARAAFESARNYAKQRRQFDRALADFQAVQFMLADMAVEIEAARWLTWRAATLKDGGRRHALEGSMAKLFASEAANRIVSQALQIYGGHGYIADHPLERYFRDARVTTLYEGTSEIQRLTIAKELLKDE